MSIFFVSFLICLSINLLRLFGDRLLKSHVVLLEMFLIVFDIVNLSVSCRNVYFVSDAFKNKRAAKGGHISWRSYEKYTKSRQAAVEVRDSLQHIWLTAKI